MGRGAKLGVVFKVNIVFLSCLDTVLPILLTICRFFPGILDVVCKFWVVLFFILLSYFPHVLKPTVLYIKAATKIYCCWNCHAWQFVARFFILERLMHFQNFELCCPAWVLPKCAKSHSLRQSLHVLIHVSGKCAIMYVWIVPIPKGSIYWQIPCLPIKYSFIGRYPTFSFWLQGIVQ